MISWKDELCHYGVKGMRWGVRKERKRSDQDSIFRSLSSTEKRFLTGEKRPKEYLNDEAYGRQTTNIASFMLKDKNGTPVTLCDCWLKVENNRIVPGVGEMSIATRSGTEYRGKGYGYKTAKRALEWIIKKTDLREVEWNPDPKNVASINLATKLGFVYRKKLQNGNLNLVYTIPRP